MSEKNNESVKSNFIREIIDEDLKQGKNDGRVTTRFPPEPNGYLHIGHAKSICLNFGIARDYGGVCNLRMDDTNPEAEDIEYVESIMEDIRWLGFDWEDRLFFASDYYDQLYLWAEQLIVEGKAYVCELNENEFKEYRGNFYTPGKESPYRNRTPEENLDLFRRMRDGEFPDGAKVLRAKIDMQSPNMNMRDPVMYRIKRAHHHRTGDKWLIYPMYDFAHGQSDALEKITHSICTLEFEDHRPLYDWFLRELRLERPPRQIEFARLNLTYTVISKRWLLALVESGKVSGWDDPRMPTIAGVRRRGYPPAAIRNFADIIGVAKADTTVDIALLEHTVRDYLNENAPRVMAVLDPLKVVIENYPEDRVDEFEIPYHPQHPELGTRKVPFSRELYIERDDFREDPPKKFFRLAPGAEVRLRAACLIKCERVIKDESGKVVELRCTWDPESLGGTPADGRKVKGTLHWVSAKHALDAEVRLYDRLFTVEDPMASGDYLSVLNPDSLQTLTGCKVEPILADAKSEERFQFERNGYFVADRREHQVDNLVFNRTVTLRDSWAKIEATDQDPAKVTAKPATVAQLPVEPLATEISFDDFTKLDMRVAKVLDAKSVEGADKLLQLTLDLGPLGQRNVFAGIAKHVSDPASLIGKLVVCAANLTPRKMRFGLSEGMVIAASNKTPQGEHVTLVEAPGGKPGERLH